MQKKTGASKRVIAVKLGDVSRSKFGTSFLSKKRISRRVRLSKFKVSTPLSRSLFDKEESLFSGKDVKVVHRISMDTAFMRIGYTKVSIWKDRNPLTEILSMEEKFSLSLQPVKTSRRIIKNQGCLRHKY